MRMFAPGNKGMIKSHETESLPALVAAEGVDATACWTENERETALSSKPWMCQESITQHWR